MPTDGQQVSETAKCIHCGESIYLGHASGSQRKWYHKRSSNSLCFIGGNAVDEAEPVAVPPAPTEIPMTGTELIAAERERQQRVEGWTPEHDDGHDLGEMTIAAWAYAQQSINLVRGHKKVVRPDWWPWDKTWWKPSPDPICNLVKAGALIAAEIDRLQRAAFEGKRA